LDDRKSHYLRHLIAFLQHDAPAMQQELTWLRDHGAPVQALSGEALVLGYYGRFNDRYQLLQRAKSVAANKAEAAKYPEADVPVFQMSSAVQISDVEY
jgi:hypothetical protein